MVGVDNKITKQCWKRSWKPLFKFLPTILNLLLFLNLRRVTVENLENCVTNQCMNKYSLLTQNIQTNLKGPAAIVVGTNKP